MSIHFEPHKTLNVILLKMDCLLRILVNHPTPLVMSLCLSACVLVSLVLKARSFISEDEPQNLVDLMGDNLETISTKAFQTLKETCFTEVFEHLEALDDEKDVCRLRERSSFQISFSINRCRI